MGKIRFPKAGTPHLGTAKLRRMAIRSAQLREPEAGIVENRIPQVAISEVGAFEPRGLQVSTLGPPRTAEPGIRQPRPPQVYSHKRNVAVVVQFPRLIVLLVEVCTPEIGFELVSCTPLIPTLDALE